MIQMNLKQVRILVFRFFQNELQTVDFLLNCCLFFGSFKSSLPEVSYEKGSLKDFAKFAGLCQSLFLNKVAGLRYRCFPLNFGKYLFSRTSPVAAFKAFKYEWRYVCIITNTKKYLQFDWFRKVQYRHYCIPPFFLNIKRYYTLQ